MQSKTQIAIATVSGILLLTLAAPGEAAGLDDLAAAAKAEGQLTIIAPPRSWFRPPITSG